MATPVLVVPRTLGPLWFLAIGLTVLLWHGPRRSQLILRTRWRDVAALAVVAGVSAALNMGWVLGAGGYSGEAPLAGAPPEVDLGVAFSFPTWALQMVAAFPLRNEPSALWVYPIGLAMVGVLVGWALLRTRGSQRLALVTCAVLVFAIPMSLTLVTLQDRGGEFQGRYVLPYAVGLVLMAGVALDRHDVAPTEGPRLRLVGVVALGAMQAGSVHNVVTEELRQAVSSADAGWVHPAPWVLVATTIVASACWLAALTQPRRVP